MLDGNNRLFAEEFMKISRLLNFKNKSREDHTGIKLYKYSDDAIKFTDFRIGNFEGAMNDSFEVHSLSDKIKNPILRRLAKVAKARGKVYATFTTLSNENVCYMVSNYSIKEQTRAEYCFSKVIEKFEDLESSIIKPIHGFVTYCDDAQLEMAADAIQRSFEYDQEVGALLALVLPFFFKRKFAKNEEEYRFILLSRNTTRDYFSIDESPEVFKFDFCSEDNCCLKYNNFYGNPTYLNSVTPHFMENKM